MVCCMRRGPENHHRPMAVRVNGQTLTLRTSARTGARPPRRRAPAVPCRAAMDGFSNLAACCRSLCSSQRPPIRPRMADPCSAPAPGASQPIHMAGFPTVVGARWRRDRTRSARPATTPSTCPVNRKPPAPDRWLCNLEHIPAMASPDRRRGTVQPPPAGRKSRRQGLPAAVLPTGGNRRIAARCCAAGRHLATYDPKAPTGRCWRCVACRTGSRPRPGRAGCACSCCCWRASCPTAWPTSRPPRAQGGARRRRGRQ